MKYRGQVKNGVIEFEGKLPFEEGTVVEIESVEESAQKPLRGSPEAILQWAGIWEDQAEDFDRSLEELREMKRAELKAQLERERTNPEPGL